MSFYKRFTKLGPSEKIAISGAASVIFCVSAYLLSRNWAINQRPKNLETRKRITEEFKAKAMEAQSK